MSSSKSLIYLIGFMGAGKSTLGSQLADKLRWQFIDTDKLIEINQKCSINEIFKTRGEKYFRNLETKILQTLAKNICNFSNISDRHKGTKAQRHKAKWNSRNFSRDLEKKNLFFHRQAVIATGGGIILRKQNRDIMNRTGYTIWLKWELNNLLRNVTNNPITRPLFTSKSAFLKLYRKRERLYATADLIINCDNKDNNTIIDEILQYMKFFNNI